jgi:hypothetical protein
VCTRDYHLFGPIKKQLSGRHFTSGEEIHLEILSWLMGSDKGSVCSGMSNRVKRWYRCPNKYDDYVAKQLMYTRFFLYNFALF